MMADTYRRLLESLFLLGGASNGNTYLNALRRKRRLSLVKSLIQVV
jgi:hypothetical protein